MLFNEYPDNFFALLHCRYQSLYADILLKIYSLFYGQDAINQPTREDVKDIIAVVLEQKEITEWEDELKGDDSEKAELNLDEIRYRSHLIYKRLIECGWLEEERDDNFRDLVSMPFYAAAILGVLQNAFLGRKVSYASYVGNVYLQLQHLKNNPEEASFLIEARRNAEELLKKLQELYNSVKTFIRQAGEKDSIAGVLSHFFHNYMEQFFSSAYGKVKTVDNPFKYRYRIHKMLIELRGDKEFLKKIAASSGRSLSEIIEDIDSIEAVFSRLDSQLSMIDSKKEQYERIVREQIRYFEGEHGDIKTSIAYILKTIGDYPEIAAEFLSKLAPNINEFLYIDEESLSMPKTSKEIISRSVVNNRLDGTELNIERMRSISRIASSVGAKEVVEFIKKLLKDRPEILGSEMEIQSLKDLTCAVLSKYIASDTHLFKVDNLRKEAENRYIIFNDFRIKRRI